ncbi:UbiA family prenyltransferase [Isoptericola aurantiacus]|uniref:UbiA family prenyltransferase n=1 Tax=Isoptericola aurantiacus TaxID=3377839 RepID=UPI00383AFC8D
MAGLGTQVRGMLASTHPAPAAVVTLFAGVLAFAVLPSVGRALLVTAAVGAGQLSIGWSNDWLDADRDRRVGRTDKPAVRGVVAPEQLRTAALLAVVGCAVLSFAAGWVAGALHLVAVASGWAYNLGLKSTVWSWVPYAVTFGLLPAFVVAGGGDGRVVAGWAVAAAALLGVGAHVANVLPDLEDDDATGVRGMPHRLGRRAGSVVAPLLLASGCVVTLAGPPGAPTVAASVLTGAACLLAAAAGVVGVLRPRSRAPFGLSMAVAALCVVEVALAAGAVAV